MTFWYPCPTATTTGGGRAREGGAYRGGFAAAVL